MPAKPVDEAKITRVKSPASLRLDPVLYSPAKAKITIQPSAVSKTSYQYFSQGRLNKTGRMLLVMK